MNWVDWIIVALLSLGCIATVSIVGKPRDKMTPGVAAIVVLLNLGIIIGLITTH